MAPSPALASSRSVGDFAPAFALTRGIVPPHDMPGEEAIAALTLGGRVILVDLSQHELDGKSLAAVIRWDGSIGLEYARSYNGGHNFAGERSGMFDVVPLHGRAAQSEGCLILGRVLEQD